MIATSKEYQAAIVGSPRRIDILAVVDLSDPDMTWGQAISNGAAPWSDLEQVHDKDFNPPDRYATLERNRWILDGSFKIFPDGYAAQGQSGYASNVVSGADGTFSTPVWVEQQFSNVGTLQMLSVFFSNDPADGVPADFRIDVYSGGTVYFTKEFTGNTDPQISIQGFTVYDTTAIRFTCTKMSLPYRRLRVLEILTGLYERWSERMLATFNCTQQGEFSCLSLPYGTLSLSMDNKNRRFEPRRKDSIFQSIEERQAIDVYIGVKLPSRAYERVRLGLFYMAGDGWKTSTNDLTMNWKLVDIIGILSDRTFKPPATLPTTLGGWLKAIVSQLGENFTDRWSADPNYVDKSVTANSLEDVTGKKCGDMIRWVCQAAGTWPRADAETGKLCAEPLWNQGNKLTLANLSRYPTMKANNSIAALYFTLSNGTELIISGNSTSSAQTVTIENPFLHTADQAREAARLILAQYGGNVIETTGRGDPASEIGDVDTIWLDEGNETTGRRKSQTLQIQNGVLKDCSSTFLQADGAFNWTGRAEITASGTFKAKAGVTQLRLILVGKGGNGGTGRRGSFDGPGERGTDGAGGKVWTETISINPEQEFSVTIGENTVFGLFSSENGAVYEYGFTDIMSGSTYARTGVSSPIPGTGDGGAGGAGGEQGSMYEYVDEYGWPHTEISSLPGEGQTGENGVTGCAVVYWEEPS